MLQAQQSPTARATAADVRTFDAAVERYRKEHNCGTGEAMEAIAKADPALAQRRNTAITLGAF